MKKIRNPYNPLEQHYCFGCAERNPIGLALQFWLDGQTVKSSWHPDKRYQGYVEILHGGIVATLLDEIAGWAVQVVCKTAGMTKEMKVYYHQPLYTNEKEIFLEAKPVSTNGRLVDIEAVLFDGKGEKCASALVTYHLFSEETARQKMHYPGIEAFIENDD
ncbi:MAG: PaaI family thioesterase [Bacteroidales bacterium]|nr:PaaI family thioesterase [Bacteroidales bacterium]